MKTPEEVEVLLEGLDENNISSVLKKWQEIVSVRKKIVEIEEMLKSKTKAYLKERKWDSYKDKETNINIRLSSLQREIIDKSQLKLMLTDAQYAQVVRTTTYERLSIIDEEARKRLKKYATKKKL